MNYCASASIHRKECQAEVMLIGQFRSSMRGWLYLLGPVVACVLWAVLAPAALATGSEPAMDVRIDPDAVPGGIGRQ